jgi:tyrosyl-tRNA synthetase
MFGKIMSIPDNIMLKYFELLTDEDMDKVKEMIETNPRDAKIHLAYLIVKQYYGEEVAKKEKEEFERVFSKKELPTDIPVISVKKGKYNLVDFLFNQKLVSSKSEAKRLLSQGGVKLDSKKVEDINAILDLENQNEILIQIGKLKFVKISRV